MRCIIIDDEFPSREELKYFINNFSNIKIEKEFDNAMDALKYIHVNQIKIIFLDINMPILDGIELSRILYKSNRNIKVVFITAYKDHALEAFEVHAFDYILKPYSKERIISALERLEKFEEDITVTESSRIDNLEGITNDKISVIKDEKIFVIDTSDIYYVEAEGRKVKIYTKEKEYYSKIKISEIENRLNNNEFYKVHRSYIVNLKKVAEIEPWFNGTYVLKMNDIKKEIPVSRNNAKEFKHIIGLK